MGWVQAQELFGQLDLEFDVPFNQFAFTGVPFKTSAKIIPCVNCLVSLLRPPPMRARLVAVARFGMTERTAVQRLLQTSAVASC